MAQLVTALVVVLALGGAFAVAHWQTRRDRRAGLVPDPFVESRARFDARRRDGD